MKSLSEVTDFGSTDADNDEILLQAFEDHESYSDILNFQKNVVIGKKGSGKTAIFKKIITTNLPDTFCLGQTFADYPWEHHSLQADQGVPELDKYKHSWTYLILLSAAKMLLNKDVSIKKNSQEIQILESFIKDTYGSVNPDLSKIFNPSQRVVLNPTLNIDLGVLKGEISPEAIPMEKLPVVVQEINKALITTLIQSLHTKNKYFIAFDELDQGFDNKTSDYNNRLIGLLRASREINKKAKEAQKQFSIIIFLRDDIYEILQFEDKNRITENFVTKIEWDSADKLKSLMEKRFASVLAENIEEKNKIKWDNVFDRKKIAGQQTKYNFILDRSYQRPRDIIKFTNCCLKNLKKRVREAAPTAKLKAKFENEDIHGSRPDYSEYFKNEIDDEIHKHFPEYKKYLDILSAIGYVHFERPEYEKAYAKQNDLKLSANQALEKLFLYSIIGFYRVGGLGEGGSKYLFKYKYRYGQFDQSATRFKVHLGLAETLGLKQKQRS